MEAMFYEKASGSALKCLLCPRGCVIKPSETGFCRVRENNAGTLEIPFYGMVSSIALDPIEKKPLYMYKQGSKILSLGGYSCNLRCAWCQNHSISMSKPEMEFYPPEAVAELAVRLKAKGNIGVAYTYNEPFIHYEYILDCAKKTREAELDNTLVTNGYIEPEPLRGILPYIDAMNIDLKGFTDDFYKHIAGGLESVLNTIETAVKSCHVEVTTLIIPEENDNPDEMDKMSERLAEINRNIPLHLTRFYPRYKMTDKNPTETGIIAKLGEIAAKHLKYVFPIR